MFAKASSMMNSIYKGIASITLVTAGTCMAICLFLIIFSKNQKTVDSSVAWLKRIAIAAVGILAMSTIISFFTSSDTGLGLSTDASL